MEKITDTILEQKISNDLCKRFRKVIDLVELEKCIKKNGITKTIGCYFVAEDLDNIESRVINTLSENPSTFIKNAFGLKIEDVDIKYTVSGENYDRFELRGDCFNQANIPGYSQILLVRNTGLIHSYHMEDKEMDLSNEAGIELNIHIIAPFEKKVYYSCKYNCYSISDFVFLMK